MRKAETNQFSSVECWNRKLLSTLNYQKGLTPHPWRSLNKIKQESKIIGVTLRIGRFFKGSAGLIDDLLFPVEDSPGTMTTYFNRVL